MEWYHPTINVDGLLLAGFFAFCSKNMNLTSSSLTTQTNTKTIDAWKKWEQTRDTLVIQPTMAPNAHFSREQRVYCYEISNYNNLYINNYGDSMAISVHKVTNKGGTESTYFNTTLTK